MWQQEHEAGGDIAFVVRNTEREMNNGVQLTFSFLLNLGLRSSMKLVSLTFKIVLCDKTFPGEMLCIYLLTPRLRAHNRSK